MQRGGLKLYALSKSNVREHIAEISHATRHPIAIVEFGLDVSGPLLRCCDTCKTPLRFNTSVTLKR